MPKKEKKKCPVPPKKFTGKDGPAKEKEEKTEYEKEEDRPKNKKGDREGTRDLEFH